MRHTGTMTKHFLMFAAYPEGSHLRFSDQITVPRHLWAKLDQDHTGHGPIFVQLGSLRDLDTYETGIVGRLVPSTDEYGTTCQVSEWILSTLDAMEGWVEVRELPDAGTIVLRAEKEATVTGAADPVAMLTDALTGVTGMPWACLSVGQRLRLSCGVFDVMEIRSVEEFPVSAAAILDIDVNLDFVPALDHRPPTPIPAGPELFMPALDHRPPTDFGPMVLPAAATSGFIPFSGVGRRLGSA